MANPGGGIGAKFVSVNLNKSYGQSSYPSHQHYSGSYGSAATFGRSRTGVGGGGVGGGMVVLSRSRTLQKAGPKLSVPPPLNLPSLRKEHEKFDSTGSTGGHVGGARPGSGQRPTSSGVGWTKPVAVASQDKDGGGSNNQVEQSAHGVDGLENRVSNAYLPPSSRSSGASVGVFSAISGRTLPAPVGKTVVLRGEDFPSLQAAVPVSSGIGMKHKDNVNQKAKTEISTDNQRNSYQMRSGVDVHSQEQSSSMISGIGPMERGGSDSNRADPSRKNEEYFPSPLPLFRLSPRSDWADDERDTGHGFADRTRDLGISKTEHYWERDFDIPRASILPHKPAPDRWVFHNDEAGRKISGDVSRIDPYRRDARTPSREGKEGNMWRSSTVHIEALNSQEATTVQNANGARMNVQHKDFGKDSKFFSQHDEDPSQGSSVLSGNHEASFKTKNSVQEGRPPWNRSKDSFNRGPEPSVREHLVKEQSSKYKGDNFHSNVSKPYFVSSGKMSTDIDSSWVSGREKGGSAKSGRSYIEDPFDSFTAFDEKDPFSGNIVGVIRKKKDLNKQTDFVDPVRESFEAELERVQKMQELERQRLVEEQERALEQARRQEEERQRLIREDEEQRRRMEEEAKEAAWRAEQERQGAIRRAEEQRIAKEEEKRRMLMEEERTKQAARQKLLELEARIAKRQAEAGKTDASDASNIVDEKLSPAVTINSVSALADIETWEDRERMVERRKASASLDPSFSNRPLDMSSRSYSRENPSAIADKGKHFPMWQRGALDNGSNSSWQIQDPRSGLLSPRRDSFDSGAGYMSSRIHPRGLMTEPYAYEFNHQKDQRWNFPAESDSYSRSRDMDAEYQDYAAEKFSDGGWDQSRFRGNSQSYLEQQYSNYEADEPFQYGRSRFSLRQPRVLPPPSVASTQRMSFKASNGDPAHPEFLHSNEQYNSAGRSEPTTETGYYTGHQDGLEQSDLADIQKENTSCGNQELLKGTLRCDSQSSVSVSSPPNSPPHLSHDELDESVDSPLSAAADVKQIPLYGNGSVVYNDNSAQRIDMTASSCISAVDDEEWTVENNDVHQQDEYDEDGNGYKEEDEAREGDEENLDLNHDFEDVEENGTTIHIDNTLDLGFDEGVEVEIQNDDFERDVINQESRAPIPDPKRDVREVEMVMGVGGEQSHEHLDGFSQATVTHETEKSIQDSAVQALSDAFVSFTADDTGPSKQTKSSAVEVPISAVPATSLTTSSHGQLDNPVRVQFGLFSGPSLIPSSVPAIQIGSIQMPLHLHPPVGSSFSHVQPSQPPIFQFGSIFQGVLPLPSQSLSFVQPNVKSVFSLSTGGTLPTQPTQDADRAVMKNDVSSPVVNDQPGFVSGIPGYPHGLTWESSSVAIQEKSADNASHSQITSAQVSTGENKLTSESLAQAEVGSRSEMVMNHHKPSSTGSQPGSQSQSLQTAGDSMRNDQNPGGFQTHGHFSGGRGKRFTYAVKNSNLRSSFPASDLPSSDANGFHRRPRRTIQRTEFRVRENVERRPPANSASYNNSHLDDNGKSNLGFSRSVSKRVTTSSRPFKPMAGSKSFLSGNSNSREIDSGNHMRKEIVKDMVVSGQNLSEHGDANLKRNSREDFDAPLQSGVVRVFKQPGIEAPSDEDDFIEVRSKRQMLNDRREQREKEIKAKSRVEKAIPRKTHAVRSGFVESAYSKKVSGSLQGGLPQNVRSGLRSSDGQGLSNNEASATLVSQPLAPIGTPAVKSEIPFDKKSQVKTLDASSISAVSGGSKELDTIVKFEDKNTSIDNIPMTLKSWDPVRTSQQVMILTQTQLAEAMKPPLSDAQINSVGSHSSATSEPHLLSSSMLLKDRSFSSAASPINSLLAGEKIQFGAVTSPTLLPPSERAPGSSRPDIHISHNLSMDEDECSIFFDKDKESDVSYIHLQDQEAEAEAAASAVAVAAISSDEVVGNGLGSALSDSKGFGGADIGAVTSGMHGDQKLGSHSQAEEHLSVSLPADLSVETTPISLWPPLPSPQGSSGQLLSHFPGGQPSNFPFYDMNSVLGGQIYTFGPQEGGSGSQSQQPDKSSSATSSGPPGTWQHCPPPTVDSFYGPPAGYAGPFINHPGGVPGVQGPPHMVVYNHFAPVAQFGQVGLSFMGPTFIPSGKPLDWKHSGPSPSIGVSDGHLNSGNIGSVQLNPPNISPPMQHLAQGSPMMPVPSGLTMFDVSPFQAQPDMSVQARWSHVPTSPLHAVPIWHSIQQQQQQQAEGLAPPQFGRTHSSDQSVNISRFSEPRTSNPSESEVNAAGKLPDELGLLDSSSNSTTTTGGPSSNAQSNVMGQSSSGIVVGGGDAVKKADNNTRNGGDNNNREATHNQSHGGYKSRAVQQQQQQQKKNSSSSQHGYSSVNYNNYQRGGGGAGTSQQRNNSGNDWSNRRPSFHGRNLSFGAEKGFSNSTKVKQVYVAKQTTSGT